MVGITARITAVDVGILVACLALTAMFAVPRHNQIASDARRAEVASLARNVERAAGLAHLLWESSGRPATVSGSRGKVAMINGYPSIATLPLMLDGPEVMSFDYERGSWRHGGVRAGRSCGVSYAPPVGADAHPAITPLLAGC